MNPRLESARFLSFPRRCRLTKRNDFQAVLDGGEKIVTQHLVVCAQVNAQPQADKDERPYDRMGLIVSRKVGGAVARNAVKRWLRESFRHRRPMAGGTATDLVIIARRNSFEAGFEKLDSALDYSLRKLNARRRTTPRTVEGEL